MRRALLFLLALLAVLPLSSCGGYQRYQSIVPGMFDVDTVITGFAQSKAAFDRGAKAASAIIQKNGKLFDIYNDYKGMANLKTINDNAGTAPVEVDPAILDLLDFSIDACRFTDGAVNIAMGPVLRIWHRYREEGLASPKDARLPPMEALGRAAEHMSVENIVIDREAGTVYLKAGMSLDVGAVAKGYTAQRALEAAVAAGLESVLINMGGNVAAHGTPMDGRDRWAVGIQDPGWDSGARTILDTVFVTDMAVVSSGDYQRYYTVDGKRYNHIIDPQTLMPAGRFAHVTVLHPDSGVADALSTALFLLPLEEGRRLLEQSGGAGMWLGVDGTIEATEGFAAVSEALSGYTATDEPR